MPTWGVQGQADWDTGPVTLTSITAYRRWKWDSELRWRSDRRQCRHASIVITNQQQFSQEFRATSNTGGAIDYTGGLYISGKRQTTCRSRPMAAMLRPGLERRIRQVRRSQPCPPRRSTGLAGLSHVVPQTYSYAAYGQSTWHITPAFRLTGGPALHLRAQDRILRRLSRHMEQHACSAQQFSYRPAAEHRIPARHLFADRLVYREKDTSNLSGTLIAAYDVTPDVHTYASYSRGYKSPGINLVAQSLGVDIFVRPEVVDNYELGVKSRFLSDRAEANLTLFWTDDQDYQANYINYLVTPNRSYISNIGDVRSRGRRDRYAGNARQRTEYRTERNL